MPVQSNFNLGKGSLDTASAKQVKSLNCLAKLSLLLKRNAIPPSPSLVFYIFQVKQILILIPYCSLLEKNFNFINVLIENERKLFWSNSA